MSFVVRAARAYLRGCRRALHVPCLCARPWDAHSQALDIGGRAVQDSDVSGGGGSGLGPRQPVSGGFCVTTSALVHFDFEAACVNVRAEETFTNCSLHWSNAALPA